MSGNYKHEGMPLNETIIRSILNKAILYSLWPQQGWLSVREFKDRIEQLHLRNGGQPFQLRDFHTNLRDILRELESQGKAELVMEGGKGYWRLVVSNYVGS